MREYPSKRFNVKPAPFEKTLKLKVVVADDDANVRKLLHRVIDQHLSSKHPGVHAEFFHASNGTDAITHIDEQAPHAVFTDFLMPGANGDEVIARARQRNVPFVVGLSAANQTEMATALKSHRDAGGTGLFIRKPYEIAMVKEAVDTLVALMRQLKG